jgi:hypothetical protein
MFATNLILKDTTLTQLPSSLSPLTISASSPPVTSSFPSPPDTSTTAPPPKMSTYTRTALSTNAMTSHFCPVCGTTLYRTSSGFPGMVVIKIGTIDDLSLADNEILRPEVEQFVRSRVGWLAHGRHGHGENGEGGVLVEGARVEVGNFFC